MISYYCAKTIADAPFTLFNVCLYTIGTNWWTGQAQDADRFGFILFLCVIMAFLGQSIALLIGAVWALNPDRAIFVAPVSQLPLVLLSGFFIKIESMPKLAQLTSYLSYWRYSFELTVQTTYGMNKCGSHNNSNDLPNEFSVIGRLGNIVRDAGIEVSSIISFLSLKLFDKPEYANQLSQLETDLNKLNAHYANHTMSPSINETGLNYANHYQESYIMKFFSLTDEAIWFNITVLIMFVVILRIAAYFALCLKVNNRL